MTTTTVSRSITANPVFFTTNPLSRHRHRWLPLAAPNLAFVLIAILAVVICGVLGSAILQLNG